MSAEKRDALFLALVLGLGCLQMAGWVLDKPALQAVGKASVASPLPLVFSSHDGLETFAQDFSLEVHREGQIETLALDAKRYQLLEGSYNRRNTYGALFSFGPLLEESVPEVLTSVLHYSLCEPGALVSECDIPTPFDSIVIEARAHATPDSTWRKEVICP